jgi:hypothetical protein
MSEEVQKKIDGLVAKLLAPRVPKRRYTPIHGRGGTMKVQAPSRLADLDGSRRPGGEVRVALGQGKAPKRRFNPGDRFEYDGSHWELLFMYRLRNEPSVWYHVLAERKPNDLRLIDHVVRALGGGETTPRIVLTPFADRWEADRFFGDIPREGDSLIRTTQQLLAMKRVVTQSQLPG